MTIQWFPGHMAKARREVTEQLKRVDMVVELTDARIPLSSRNPMLDDVIGEKKRLVILTKSDLADEKLTKEWINWFKNDGAAAMAINAHTDAGIKEMIQKSKEITSPIFDKMRKKGIRPRPIRAMIVGIPNVGKSTLINRLHGKKTAKTGDRPGVTKAQQWLKVGKEMELLDTPGILWPKFEDQQIGYRLAATGAIKDELLDFQDIALFALNTFKSRYPERLKERYQLEEPLPEDGVELFEEIGKKRGCLMSGGFIDYDKAAEIVLRDLRGGKLGSFTLETPEEWKEKGTES
ncbi:ribosome biogenesis GTPase YlqF [Thalassorhabdus alkalitolerans]|uniref:Ribosome biogenesis GTPase A n=1 Tax=Thalassorhabdus alkalitolerans TaxID=2282697 RepID=A0ABW0YL23_9BACI|nr:ribosome biogenesis GTPase YlqF [Thalassobacillus sp. C254]